jgi:hypothetical protein
MKKITETTKKYTHAVLSKGPKKVDIKSAIILYIKFFFQLKK